MLKFVFHLTTNSALHHEPQSDAAERYLYSKSSLVPDSDQKKAAVSSDSVADADLVCPRTCKGQMHAVWYKIS